MYELVFDEVIHKQLNKIKTKHDIQKIISDMLNKIELVGPDAGKLIDSKLFIYEIKCKNPPIRLYYKFKKEKNECYIFEFEMKTSEKKQKTTIEKIKEKTIKIFRNLNLFLSIS